MNAMNLGPQDPDELDEDHATPQGDHATPQLDHATPQEGFRGGHATPQLQNEENE